MTSVTGVHADLLAALTGAGVHAVFGPAHDLPTGPDGLVGQAAVLWPSPGLHQYTRSSGESSGRGDRVTITCVGASSFDALAVADQVEAAIGGRRSSSKGGTWVQSIATTPVPEPNTNPVRVSLAVEYSTVTKGDLNAES